MKGGLRVKGVVHACLCDVVCRASLELYAECGGVDALRVKSLALTGYLSSLLDAELSDEVTVITPAEEGQRGCQLSLCFKRPVRGVYAALQREGIITDVREVRGRDEMEWRGGAGAGGWCDISLRAAAWLAASRHAGSAGTPVQHRCRRAGVRDHAEDVPGGAGGDGGDAEAERFGRW